MNQINNVLYLKERRKALRKQLTPAEAVLWRILKSKGLGVKFRRQHSIRNYILDFYCPSHLLAIELDGEPHFNTDRMERDAKRDAYLKRLGIKTIRIENAHVFERTDFVIELIKENLYSRSSLSESKE